MSSLGAGSASARSARSRVVARVQVVRPTTYVVKPHLGVQADGGRRFEYNPRVLDLIRRLPRGTIYDRQGLRSRPTIRGQSLPHAPGVRSARRSRSASACPESGRTVLSARRPAFHVLGDVRSRVNWSAPNTSYVERDAEDRLRGFDDHASTVQTTDSSGQPMSTLRRDYRDLVPCFAIGTIRIIRRSLR